jgi:hypothetical protein
MPRASAPRSDWAGQGQFRVEELGDNEIRRCLIGKLSGAVN